MPYTGNIKPPFTTVCEICLIQYCVHHPSEITINRRTVSTKLIVLRNDGRKFENALMYHDGYIKYGKEIK